MIVCNPLTPEISGAGKISGTSLTGLLTVFAFAAAGGAKMLRCSGYPSQALTSGTTYTVGTLPAGYRPSVALSPYLLIRNGVTGLLSVGLDGVVTITPYAAVSTNQGINFVLPYV